MDDHNLLDSEFEEEGQIEILSLNNFIILFFLTSGIYGVWWMYKSWRFFKEKDNLDIMPALRAIFTLFFLFSLFERIQAFAQSKGYVNKFPSFVLFIGFVLFNLTAYLPDPMWVIANLAFVCLIPPFNAFNYALIESEDIRTYERESFNQRQIVLVVLGILMWIMIVYGLIMGE